jgi:hypothetical protein
VRNAQGEDAVTEPVTRRKYVVEPTRAPAVDVDELVAAIGKKRPKLRPATGDAWAYVHTIADWQIGKTAYGMGSEQTTQRILDGLDASLTRYKAEAKRRPIGTVVLASLGDLCEGTTSQGGAVHLAYSSNTSKNSPRSPSRSSSPPPPATTTKPTGSWASPPPPTTPSP